GVRSGTAARARGVSARDRFRGQARRHSRLQRQASAAVYWSLAALRLVPNTVGEDLAQESVRDREGPPSSLDLLAVAPRLERHDTPRGAGGQPQQRLHSPHAVFAVSTYGRDKTGVHALWLLLAAATIRTALLLDKYRHSPHA